MEYKIVEAFTIENLQFRVNQQIKDGFKPLGGVCVMFNSVGNQFYQAMTKESKND